MDGGFTHDFGHLSPRDEALVSNLATHSQDCERERDRQQNRWHQRMSEVADREHRHKHDSERKQQDRAAPHEEQERGHEEQQEQLQIESDGHTDFGQAGRAPIAIWISGSGNRPCRSRTTMPETASASSSTKR